MSTHACSAHFASSSISNPPCPVPNRRPKHDARRLQGRAERLRVRDRPLAGGFEFSLGGNRVAMAIHDLNLKLRECLRSSAIVAERLSIAYLFARRFDCGLPPRLFATTQRFAGRLAFPRGTSRSGLRSISARLLATARVMTVAS